MNDLDRYLRLMWRASLNDGSLLTLDEAIEAMPGSDSEVAIWLEKKVSPVGTVDDQPVYRWGDITAALAGSPPSSTDNEVMTTPEVAELLRVSVDKVRTWTAEGSIPHSKLGHRTVRFWRSEVVAWAQQTAVGSSEEINHGSPKERRRVVRRHPLQRPGDQQVEALEAYDWSRHNETGGTET